MKWTSSENAGNDSNHPLKKSLNGAFDANNIVALLKEGASFDTANDKGATLEELTLAYYLKDTVTIDSERILRTQKIYKEWPVTVYLGLVDNRNVVIKKIEYPDLKSETRKFTTLQEYCSEVHFMTRLKNAPNVIQIIGYNVEGISRNIIMEYAVNGSLEDFIKSHPNSAHNWGFRYELLRGMTNGICYIHLSHILHCDLKNANVFLDKDMQPKIADFGSAIEMYKKTNRELTTLPFRAPEVFENYDYSEQSDIWSLALMFWEVAAWMSLWSTLHTHIHTDKDMYNYFNEGKRADIPEACPPKIAALMKWGWSREPKDRPLAIEVVVELDGELDEISSNLAKYTS